MGVQISLQNPALEYGDRVELINHRVTLFVTPAGGAALFSVGLF